MSGAVNYQLTEGISEITLNDGKANVMNLAMLEEIRRAFDRAAQDNAPVILRSSLPGVFSAGFDLNVFKSGDQSALTNLVRTGALLAVHILEHPLPVLGVQAGHAFPMGAFLLLGCDFRISVRGPTKIGLNEVAIGITPPEFAVELARSRLHPAWLNRTVLLGEMFGPEDAVRAGFADHVVDPEDVDQAIGEFIKKARKLDLPSHSRAKKKLRESTLTRVRAAIQAEM